MQWAAGELVSGKALFDRISAIAFATALGAVAGLIVASITIGITLTDPERFASPSGKTAAETWHELRQPVTISIPLSFPTRINVSPVTRRKAVAPQ